MKVVVRCRSRVSVRPGFTLVELMVVILIIALLAVASLPVVVPSLQQSQINAAAQQIQADLSVAREEALRTNRPSGLRFYPESYDPSTPDAPLVYSRYVAIEQGPDYGDGLVQRGFDAGLYPPPSPPLPGLVINPYPYLVVREEKVTFINGFPVPNPPTSWYYNLRQGDKIRLNDSGKEYTIAGPIVNPGLPAGAGQSIVSSPNPDVQNPERFINFGRGYISNPATPAFEFLFLVDGEDNDSDGYVDEGFDGIDNDGDGIVDPGFNGIDDNGNGFIDEWDELFLHRNSDGSFIYPGHPTAMPMALPYPNEFEPDTWSGTFSTQPFSYTVKRRAVPTEGTRQMSLPTGVVLDATTWNAVAPYVPERSRLPIDPATGFIDVLISPGGQVVQQSFSANPAPLVELPFYHFWLCDREEVREPFPPAAGRPFRLPMLRGSGDDPNIVTPSFGIYPLDFPVLTASRRLLSLNARTGQITTTSVETFYTNNPSYPFKAAEAGVKEEP